MWGLLLVLFYKVGGLAGGDQAVGRLLWVGDEAALPVGGAVA